VTVVHQAVEERGDDDHVPRELSQVLERSV
jgi:hypothetical protein